MRFLKNKIAKAQAFENNNLHNSPDEPLQTCPEPPARPLVPVETILFEKPRTRPKTLQPSLSPKKPITGDNIMKNYGRAMVNFALSSIARPLLGPILDVLEIDLPAFHKFIEDRRKSANCIKKLREMLPVETEVHHPDYPFKKAFQEICIKFLKFFFVNWLYSSKIAEKVTHLKYRFKILRRIKNPMYFTYLKDFSL